MFNKKRFQTGGKQTSKTKSSFQDILLIKYSLLAASPLEASSGTLNVFIIKMCLCYIDVYVALKSLKNQET